MLDTSERVIILKLQISGFPRMCMCLTCAWASNRWISLKAQYRNNTTNICQRFLQKQVDGVGLKVANFSEVIKVIQNNTQTQFFTRLSKTSRSRWRPKTKEI